VTPRALDLDNLDQALHRRVLRAFRRWLLRLDIIAQMEARNNLRRATETLRPALLGLANPTGPHGEDDGDGTEA
jgi:hypothetical protein